jgi:hypothetical protein
VLVRKPSSFTRRSRGREQKKEEKKMYRLFSVANSTATHEFRHNTGHNVPERELRYSFPLPLTSALYGQG